MQEREGGREREEGRKKLVDKIEEREENKRKRVLLRKN